MRIVWKTRARMNPMFLVAMSRYRLMLLTQKILIIEVGFSVVTLIRMILWLIGKAAADTLFRWVLTPERVVGRVTVILVKISAL